MYFHYIAFLADLRIAHEHCQTYLLHFICCRICIPSFCGMKFGFTWFEFVGFAIYKEEFSHKMDKA